MADNYSEYGGIVAVLASKLVGKVYEIELKASFKQPAIVDRILNRKEGVSLCISAKQSLLPIYGYCHISSILAGLDVYC